MKEKKLNCKNAKNISIKEYFQKLGKTAVRESSFYGMYKAFWRNEKSASVKVDYGLNIFYDFGTSESGDIINLVQLINKCDVSEALKILNSNTFSFHQQPKKITEKLPIYSIKKVLPLKNNHLLNYLKEKKIDLNIAKKYCFQVHYSFSNRKQYYGIGFMNNNGSFEIRNKYFKGCLGKKEITTIFNHSNTVCLFESFTDFLAHKTLNKTKKEENYIITNSTSLVKKCIELIQNYKHVKTYFDNDASGKKATALIIQSCNTRLSNCSNSYKNHKDLNDYLINLKR
ncbi:toprim domain-containing protein [Tenacibaculum maritimum]|uniref:toprim domain-containing protein n=1 Tax=Tenacibaculum maritimum TaxID=107401 RepID=UPI0038762567